MSYTKLPSGSALSDEQFIQVAGPDGAYVGYKFDKQTNTLFVKESQTIVASGHGSTHIADDPIPEATCDTPGLMSADDKCRVESLTSTRFGVLGFMGDGFPEDGGWMSGDIILAAASGFIHLERVGNVVRFSVDSPLPMNCDCSTCVELYWVQDEVSVSSIRPPTCAGKLPGVNAYGEIKFFLFPESTIIDPANASDTLENADDYPAFTFTRYTNSNTPNKGYIQTVLERDSTNSSQVVVGWAMTPNDTMPQCVWYMGKDTQGNLREFSLSPDNVPGLLGSLLYKGHLITKKMAVITAYTSTTLSTNQYTCKMWDVDGKAVSGDAFTAVNVYEYTSPETTKTLVKDSAVNVLDIGTLVELWAFKVGSAYRYYFSKAPVVEAKLLWSSVGAVEFGNQLVARQEVEPGTAGETSASVEVDDFRIMEDSEWGLTGTVTELYLFETGTGGPVAGSNVDDQHKPEIDYSIPALVVNADTADNPFTQRPVMLWNRTSIKNGLIDLDIGCPTSSTFAPYDIIIGGPIDSYGTKHMRAVDYGVLSPSYASTEEYYVIVRGVHLHDLPQSGTVRVIRQGNFAGANIVNEVWSYTKKMAYAGTDYDGVVLTSNTQYPASTSGGDILELLPQEYNAPCVRVEFTVSTTISLQFRVGTLDMSTVYENNISSSVDDYLRGFSDGWLTSGVYTQATSFTGVGTPPAVNADNFVAYSGGSYSGTEYWNRLRIMVRDGQVWIWWNGLLIPPDADLSDGTVLGPYFTFDNQSTAGKYGVRMWPGAKIRRVDLRSQLVNFNEYNYGQLSLV